MEHENRSSRRAMTSIVCFLLAVMTALILFVVLLLEWLTMILCSDVLATLVVALTFLMAAAVIYLLSAHKAIEQIKARWDAIYDVAYSLRRAYDRLIGFLRLFLR